MTRSVENTPIGTVASPSDAARFERVGVAVATLAARIRAHDGGVQAYVRTRTGRTERDVFFGPRPSLEAEPFVLDARTAPLARLLYDIAPGDDYDLELGDRTVSGVLLERGRLVFDGDRLASIEDDERVIARDASGELRVRERACIALGAARISPPGSFGVDVTLDPVQREAAAAAPGEPMLITGEAGAGKTTVALARLVNLARLVPDFRGVYVAPTESLARFVALALERASVDGIEVTSFDGLATRLARRVFRRLPRRVATDAPAGVIRLKRHDALAAALPRFVDTRPGVEEDEDRPGAAEREDLLHLFGDRALLEALPHEDSSIRPADVDATIERTRAQFRARGEEEFADVVDATKLDALDGLSLDARTPDELAGRIDVEDLPVLFELARLRDAREGLESVLPEHFDAVVVDEAQELAVLELRLLRRLLRTGGTLVVAGDEEQRTEQGSGFHSFEATLHELGAAGARRVHLETSYRCPPGLTELVRPLRAQMAFVVAPSSQVVHARGFPNELHLVMDLAAAIRRIREHDAHATVAIVARTAATARRIALPLGPALEVELALDGRFDFRRGLHVTTVADVRGLEFDYVLLPDVDLGSYPLDDESRRALYLALTRTCVAASLSWVARPSPMLRLAGA